MVFNTSNRGAGDCFASLSSIYGFLANKAWRYHDVVSKTAILRKDNKHNGREMCNAYTLFTAEQRATMGRYASEHGKAAADA